MMLLYCLCDSFRVIWIAFHWQDLQMFESSVSSLIQFWTFHGFSYFCITKRSFRARKSKKKKKKQFGCRLHRCTWVHYTFNLSAADTIGLQSEMIIWSHYRRKLKMRGTMRGAQKGGNLLRRCVLKISRCWVFIPAAQSEFFFFPSGEMARSVAGQIEGGVTEVIISSLSGCNAHLSLILSNSSKWNWCRGKKRINTRVPPCGARLMWDKEPLESQLSRTLPPKEIIQILISY